MHSDGEQQTWKPVFDYEGLYEVNQFGDVRSLRRNNRLMAKRPNRYGYVTVCLRKNLAHKTKTVHRIVMQSFTNKSGEGLQVNHLDGNKENNHLSNLEWCTSSENARHAFRTGLRTAASSLNHPYCTFTKEQIIQLRTLYKPGRSRNALNQRQLAKKYGVCQKTISNILTYQCYKDISLLKRKDS